MATVPWPNSVAIVGGSLAGLMHALVLLSLPHPPRVRILERSPTALLHNQGAGVVAGNETQDFFDEYVKPGRDIAITSRLRHYLRRNGDEIPESVDHRQQRMTSWDLLYNLLRWRVTGEETEYVSGLEADARPKAEYENGITVTSIEPFDSKISVKWRKADGSVGTYEADMVIAADGASSTIRDFVTKNVKREYSGYVAWRGTVPETELTTEAKGAFIEKFTFYHTEAIQSLGYLIPGRGGIIEPGQRLFNWVWYCNYEKDSSEYTELMTDKNGKTHNITLPVGTMRDSVWEKQKQYAAEILPPQYAEAVSKTKQPFIQAITDVISPQNSFFENKLLLVGDALAGFRPHTAASTSQAAHNAIELGRWLRGQTTKDEYDQRIMRYATQIQKHGVELGQRSQFGHHPLAD